MRELFIDIETFSPVNLATTGLYPYADHEDFEVLLLGYSINGGPVEVVDLANGHQLSDTVLATLTAAADAEGLIDWSVSVDSTIARAHQHATNITRLTGGWIELQESA